MQAVNLDELGCLIDELCEFFNSNQFTCMNDSIKNNLFELYKNLVYKHIPEILQYHYVQYLEDYIKDTIINNNNCKKLQILNNTNPFVVLHEKFPQISIVKTENSYQYIENTINIIGLKNVHQIVHEYCHYIVATPEQRKLINFGLGVPGSGTDPESLPPSKQSLPNFHVDTIENYAGLLTIIYQNYFGQNIKECAREMGIFIEINDQYNDLTCVLYNLIKAGLVICTKDGEIIPTFKLNKGQLVIPSETDCIFPIENFIKTLTF